MLNNTQFESNVRSPMLQAAQLLLCFVIICLGLLTSVQVSAEQGSSAGNPPVTDVAQAAAAQGDEAAEALLMKQMLQQQQQNSQQQNAKQAETQRDSAARASQPNPQSSSSGSAEIQQLPKLNAPVIDLANVLNPSEVQQLSQQILNIYQAGQAQIAIVIVPTTGPESIFDFAMRVGEQWKLGSSKTDNGMVIAVAVNDRRVHIATGYGLEGVIPDIIAGQIIRKVIQPEFQQGDYGRGLGLALNQIQGILDQDPSVAAQAARDLEQRQVQATVEKDSRDKLFNAGLIIFVVGAIASGFLGRGISASTSAVTGFAAGMIYGVGILGSLMLAAGLFFLLITPLAQHVLHAILSSRGGGGGGGSGGGGFSGGGGGFGGGGASGSW